MFLIFFPPPDSLRKAYMIYTLPTPGSVNDRMPASVGFEGTDGMGIGAWEKSIHHL